MAGFATYLLGALSAFVIARLVLSLLKQPSLPLPPGPKPAPLIGNIHQLPKSLQWLELYHWSKKYGPVMHLSMGGQPLVILSTYKAAHDLLNRRSARYSDRPRMVMAGELVTRGMHMLLRQYNDQYRLHQKMEAPLLTLRAASNYRPLQDLESQQLLWDVLGEWDKYGEKGVDFHHHFERAMASTIYCLNYGYRLQTGYEQELMDGKRVQAEFARTGQVGAYIVDSFPSLNYLPRFLAPWKREAEELFELERQLHVGNLKKGLKNRKWNFTKHMKDSPEAAGMPEVELAFDLGILADAGLDTSTVALDWFIVAWITSGSRGWVKKAQQLLEEVVGKHRLPSFEDRPKLAYIDAIGTFPSLYINLNDIDVLTDQRAKPSAGAQSSYKACHTLQKSKMSTWAITFPRTRPSCPTPLPSRATRKSSARMSTASSPSAGSPSPPTRNRNRNRNTSTSAASTRQLSRISRILALDSDAESARAVSSRATSSSSRWRACCGHLMSRLGLSMRLRGRDTLCMIWTVLRAL